ncbi:MAG: hypothetical protein H7246_08580 [Phycisphaerae bacterium]|nr:hypothetical protein [Saprospiraceae bacterium]
MKPLYLLPFLLLSLSPLHAGKYFDFNASARDAYQKVLSLRFDEARVAIDVFKQREPENMIGPFVENYLEFLQIFVDDNRAAYNLFSKNKDSRLDKISRGDQNSPWNLYCQAEIRLQWAVLQGRFGDQLSCFSNLKQAYALLEENQRKHPGFLANKKSLGIIHALVGNVPEEYRWAIRAIGGISGTVEQGLAELDEVLAYAKNNDFPFEEETLMAYSFLQLYLNNQGAKAWNTLKSSKLNPKSNPLAAYALANMAIKLGKTDEAIQILQEAPKGGAYHPFYYRDYLLGLAKLYRLDLDANLPLQDFAKRFPGKNALKETYQKLAWHHLVHGNEEGYRSYMGYVKTKGSEQSDPDKAALREAKSGEMPDSRLLRGRLLFDGGYYSRAYELLKNIASDYKGQRKNSLEYTYRLGRIVHKMGQTQEAIRLYNLTIESGEKEPWYFACNAALQLGILLEEKRDLNSARAAYHRCLGIHPQEYASSLHARAKAGLGRCK